MGATCVFISLLSWNIVFQEHEQEGGNLIFAWYCSSPFVILLSRDKKNIPILLKLQSPGIATEVVNP